MSNKTNNSSDTSSTNDYYAVSKYQRSSVSNNSSESSRDTKNRESGIGASISSNSEHTNNQTHQSSSNKQRLTVEKIELLDELKSLLKFQQSNTISHGTGSVSTSRSVDSSGSKLTSDDSSSFISPSSFYTSTGRTPKDTSKKSSATVTVTSKTSTTSSTAYTSNSITNSSTTTTCSTTTINKNPNNLLNTSKNTTTGYEEENNVDSILQKAIRYIKKLQKNQINNQITTNNNTNKNNNAYDSSNSDNNNLNSGSVTSSSSPPLSIELSSSNINSKSIVKSPNQQPHDMCISILVRTGLIVYVDDRLTNLLGQQAKSWLNKRPIDYLYKDDTNLLLTKLCELTNKINSATKKSLSQIEIESFYLRFKKESNSKQSSLMTNTTSSLSNNYLTYIPNTSDSIITHMNKSYSSTYSDSNQSSEMPRLCYNKDSNEFIAFKVELKADKFKIKIPDEEEKPASINRPNQPILDTYLDIYTERSFISEHNVNLEITRVENKVTELLGYLPQDLERKSFVKFIHPEDLDKIKQIHYDIYEGRERQNQEIYRWKCYNGCYVSVKTNWSWFIHPWKKQIDFIIGKHIVLNEPLNKNIFEDVHSKKDCSKLNKVTMDTMETVDKMHLLAVGENMIKKCEKDIIDYISKKMPGVEDEATHNLGEDIIKLIKKKNISANYCQEQSKMIKKQQHKSHGVSKYAKKDFKETKNQYAFVDNKYFQQNPPVTRNKKPVITKPSKKTFQPSLIKDKGFFTHYMICKYIDDLPNTWNDGTDFERPKTSTISSINPGVSTPHATQTSVSTTEMDIANENNTNIMKKVNLENNLSLYMNKSTNREDMREQIEQMEQMEQNLILYKKASSYSSKSQSKIVLIDENDNYDEEEELLKSFKNDPKEETDNVMQTSAILPESQHYQHNLSSNYLKLHQQDPRILDARYNTDFTSAESADCEVTTSISNNKSTTNTFNTSSHGYARLTKEAIAKHTREMDELYAIEILKKVQRSLKKTSESPQNIFALAPNVFSRNEYEPPPFKKRKPNLEEKLSSPAEPENKQSFNSDPTPKSVTNEKERSGLANNENSNNNSGLYLSSINEIDCDNPQQYHEIFHKKLQTEISTSNESKTAPVYFGINKTNDQHSASSSSQQNSSNHSSENKNNNSKSSQDNSKSQSTNKSDDVLDVWRQCIKQGSRIARRLKESDSLLIALEQYLNEQRDYNENIENEDLSSSNNKGSQSTNKNKIDSKFDYLRSLKQLKTNFHSIANLLCLNTDIGDCSVDLDNSQFIDVLIKKIYHELITSLPSMTTAIEQIDPNSLELLKSIYDNLKTKFLEQFQGFNPTKSINSRTKTNESSINNKSNNNKSTNSSFNNTNPNNNPAKKIPSESSSSSILPFSSTTENNEYEETNNSSSNNNPTPSQNEKSDSNRGKEIKSKKRNSTKMSKSPNEFDFQSNSNNTNTLNDYDDSSTYLYDSPTSSFESIEHVSNFNEKTNKKQRRYSNSNSNTNKRACTGFKDDTEKIINDPAVPRIKSNESPENTEFPPALQIPALPQDKEFQEDPFLNNNSEYDDGLCSKIIQNYIDLFKSKDNSNSMDFKMKTTDTNVLSTTSKKADEKLVLVTSKPPLPPQTKPDNREASVEVEPIEESADSLTPKHNTKGSCESLSIEEECIKHLNQNIYDDCFKCLSSINAINNSKSDDSSSE